MPESKGRLYLAALGLHLLLIASVSCREILWLVSRGLSGVPGVIQSSATRGEQIAAAVTAQQLPRDNAVRRLVHGYLQLSGIEAGYGFFAPNVPDSYQLAFELQLPDGRLQFLKVEEANGELALRYATLLEYIGRASSGPLRQLLVSVIANALWHDRPELVKVRAFVSQLRVPPPADYDSQREPAFDLLDTYEFVRPGQGSLLPDK